MFSFNDSASATIYTLSLHDALPIYDIFRRAVEALAQRLVLALSIRPVAGEDVVGAPAERSEEHTSELQSQSNLVCRLLLEKKNHTSLCITHCFSPPHLQATHSHDSI